MLNEKKLQTIKTCETAKAAMGGKCIVVNAFKKQGEGSLKINK